MTNGLPPDEFLTGYFRNRLVMQPETFGVVGAYSREAMEARVPVTAAYDQQLLRLTTSVLSGRTVSEHPEVRYKFYCSWWDQLKALVSSWRNDQNYRWEGAEGTDTPPPWMVLLWPFLVLWPRFLKKHPVKMRECVVPLHFEQRILYPEFDMVPDRFGRPVVYETLEFEGLPGQNTLTTGPSRFMSKHEVIHEFYNANTSAGYGTSDRPQDFLAWLERRGVNTDQLVKRRFP